MPGPPVSGKSRWVPVPLLVGWLGWVLVADGLANTATNGLLMVQLAFRDGYVVVDEGAPDTRLLVGPEFAGSLKPGFTTNRVQRELVRHLNEEFRREGKLVDWLRRTGFDPADVPDPGALGAQWRAQRDGLSAFIWAGLPEDLQARLGLPTGDDDERAALQEDVARVLTGLCEGPNLYEPDRFLGVTLSDDARRLLKSRLGDRTRAELNRLLIEDAYPSLLTRRRLDDLPPSARRGRVPPGEETLRLARHYLGASDPGELRGFVEFLERLTVDWTNASRLFSHLGREFPRFYRDDFFPFFDRQIKQPFDDPLRRALNSPLSLKKQELGPWDENKLSERGLVLFGVRAPVLEPYAGPENIRLRYSTNVWSFAGVTRANFARLLRAEPGRLWWPQRIRRGLDDFIHRLGYDVADTGADASLATGIAVYPRRPGQRSPGVEIQGVPQIERIQIGLARTNTPAILEALYFVLPYRDYRRVRGAPEDYLRDLASPTGEEWAELDLTQPPGQGLDLAGWYVDRVKLAERLAGLDRAGYAAVLQGAPTAGDTKRAVMLITPVARGTRADPGTGARGDIASAGASGGDPLSRGNTNATAVVRQDPDATGRGPDPPPRAGTPALGARDRLGAEYRRAVEAGVTMATEEDVRVYLAYEQVGLSGADTVRASVGFEGEAFGAVDYERDLLLIPEWGRRLSVAIKGFSDFEADRLRGGEEFGERRSGGTATAALELFRDWDDHWLRVDGSAGWQEVLPEETAGAPPRDQLTEVSLGLSYFWRRDGTRWSPNLQVAPRLRGARSEATEAWFLRGGATAAAHLLLPLFLEHHLQGAVEWGSADTPWNELPSLGGEDSVRGYRVDAGVGDLAWSLQNEIWIPVFRQFRLGAGLDRFVRRNLLLAAFVDIGGVTGTADSFDGFRAGAGLGLRARISDAMAFRLDWGQALTGDEDGRGGSFVYFSLVSTRPFFD